ncbi:MAG: coproporphyrinogen III oxidase, partial [Schaalia hyovaginalis]|nr:coproporphyrinogen III oxidase [Schaalia hyovaginalis]
ASPAAAGEILDEESRRLEKVMLAVRIAEGIGTGEVPVPGAVPALIAEGLIDGRAALEGRIILTLRGRLLADRVTGALMGF